ncbi:MAG: glycosyltransferase family 4 protein [Patescibacteria group bacterium]|nr:glycosyltransferase family 4 protein [Patescibacteria group bacterium]MDD4610569.1 glycosyltransferase family 4 protein [Patescibacteria group bacterium]
MKKNILIVNSASDKNSFLEDFLVELEKRDFCFYLLSSRSELLEQFRNRHWSARRIYFGPDISNNFKFIFWLTLFPFLFIYFIFKILFLKYKLRIRTVVCLNFNEKIILSAVGAVLKLKIVWLENTEINYRKLPSLVLRFYKFFSGRVVIIVPTNRVKEQLLSLHFSEERIAVIFPGIRFGEARHQENIFYNLAKSEQSNHRRRYFTVGVVTRFNQPNQIESLLRAAKVILAVIPNLQIIIVGEGSNDEKKQVSWAAKKIGIENVIWLVGRQENLKKWLESFAVYFIASEIPTSLDLKLALKAMAAGLPVISVSGRGFEDLILENTGLFFEAGDSEMLAGQIIRLYKNKLWLYKLGQAGKALAEERFNIEKQARELEKFLIL